MTKRRPPAGLFPQELAPGVWRCGYNARSSYGAHSYFVERAGGNLLVDAPRFVAPVVRHLERRGGVADVLLTHRDDVADADRFVRHFGARALERENLQAFRDACWYSWAEQTRSLGRLVAYRFAWVLAGHGGSIRRPAEEMQVRLARLVDRMRGAA